MTSLLSEVLKLSANERIELVEAILESLPSLDRSMEFEPSQLEEIQRRYEDFKNSPSESIHWERARILLREKLNDRRFSKCHPP